MCGTGFVPRPAGGRALQDVRAALTNGMRVTHAMLRRFAGAAVGPALLTMLTAAAGLLALTAQGPAAAAQGGPWCTRIPLPRSGCKPVEVRGAHAALRLALAADPAQREHGLMNVRFVPPGEGMIFVFPDADQIRGFWMKDTITPLDMVFVRSDGSISDVAVNVPATKPHTPDDKIARRQAVARYVIELGAGQAGQLGLLPGTMLAIPPLYAK
jgi:uncharacterized protein